MKSGATTLRAAIYCRKSSEEGLEQSFNSLHAQREACEAYVASQRQEGWSVFPAQYDDGGFSGGSIERPALQRLLQDVRAKKINVIVVYKVDRLTRSLADFAKIIEILDAQGVSFVSVTQQFNTTSSMGRLTLNVLLSFAQFEREVTGERIRDKIAASKQKGMWMGGHLPLGYDQHGRTLLPNPAEAALVQKIFALYLSLGCVSKLKDELDRAQLRSKVWFRRDGTRVGGARFSRGALYVLLQNRLYIGEIRHGRLWYPGLHPGIIPKELWQRVQQQLAANRQRRSVRTGEHSSSLLVGLIKDGKGNLLTPSFTVKNKKRYRYYVSRAVIKNPRTKLQEPTRWPAKQLETIVLDTVESFLLSEAAVFDEYYIADADLERVRQQVRAAGDLGSRWPQLDPAEIRNFVSSCLSGVIVDHNAVKVLLDKEALSHCLLGNDVDEIIAPPPGDARALIHLQAAAKLQRCGREVCLLVPSTGGENKTRPRPVPSLIKAIARAHAWYDRLLNGNTENCTSLAAQLGVGDRYVSRVMAFAFLAPDIIESILNGTQPPALTFAKMAPHIPLSWTEQRQRFGFSPVAAR